MKLVIELRDEWLDDLDRALSGAGSNDEEHDLLIEVADVIERARSADAAPPGYPRS
jgi:truncated hemoglobin YjbI